MPREDMLPEESISRVEAAEAESGSRSVKLKPPDVAPRRVANRSERVGIAVEVPNSGWKRWELRDLGCKGVAGREACGARHRGPSFMESHGGDRHGRRKRPARRWR